MPVQSYYPTLFDKSNTEGWLSHLDNRGFVVIKNVLTPSELEKSKSQFIADWKKVCPQFSFSDQTTWNINNTPIMWSKGMCVFSGLPQSDFMWNLRTNKEIQNIFKKIYQTDNLVSSLDGLSVFLDNSHKSKSWLHIDQNPKNEIYSIQASFNLLPVKSNKDASFIIVPDSHKTYKPIVTHKNDWIVCEDQTAQMANAKKLIIPENCLTLWNSRLIHANEAIMMSKTEFESKIAATHYSQSNPLALVNRVTAYITYQPKSLRPDTILEKRIGCYKSGQGTSHWANKCEVKRYPFGFKKNYLARNIVMLNPQLEDDGSIPIDRLELL